jgi:hypothetical protein
MITTISIDIIIIIVIIIIIIGFNCFLLFDINPIIDDENFGNGLAFQRR